MAKKIEHMSMCNELIGTCTLQVDLNDGCIIMIDIYWPHSGTILEFTDELDDICDLPIVQK